MIKISTLQKQVIILVGGSVGANIIAVVSIPIITRLYDADQIGTVSLLMSLVSFWTSFQLLRYDSAFYIVKTAVELNHLLVLCVICLLCTSGLVIPAYYLLVENDIMGFGLLHHEYVLAVFLICLGTGGFLLFHHYNIRQEEFKTISKSTIYRSIGNNGTKICFGLLGGGITGLIVAETVGAWASLVTMSSSARKNMRNIKWGFSVQKLSFTAKKNRVFPYIEMPSAIINSFNQALLIPAMIYLFGPKEAGLFALSYRIAALPNSQIGQAIGNVFNMKFAEYVRKKDKEKALSLFYNTMKKLLFIGALPFLGFLFLSPLLAKSILGEKWQDVGWYIAIMAPWLYSSLIVSPLSRILSIYKLVNIKLIYDFTVLLLSISMIIIIKKYNFGVGWFLGGIMVSYVLSYVIYGLLLVLVVKKKTALDNG